MTNLTPRGPRRIAEEVIAVKGYIRLLKRAQKLQEFCEWNELPYPEPLRRMLGLSEVR